MSPGGHRPGRKAGALVVLGFLLGRYRFLGDMAAPIIALLKPVSPLFVTRMVALAKATSVAAAIIAGFTAGFDVYLAGSLNASTPREDALTAVITFVAAVLLACAALYLENSCRVPEDPDAAQPDH